MNLDEYQQLKKRVDDLQRKYDQATGALEQLKAQRKKDFGVSTNKEATKRLQELERKEAELKNKVEAALQEFESQYGQLGESDDE